MFSYTETDTISIDVREENGKLLIEVSDNGSGFPENMLGPYNVSKEKAEGHLGLYNVNTILSKHYGEGAGLFLANSSTGGAVVCAVLDINEKEDN